MRSASDNPFRPAPGSLPPALAGRTPEVSAVYHAASLTASGGAAQPIVFTGLRGMGKTALLRRCVNEASDAGAVVLYAEASRETRVTAALRRSLEHAKTRYRSLPEKLKSAFDATIATLPKTTLELPHDAGAISLEAHAHAEEHEPLIEALETLNVALRRHDRFLAFAIDELQDGAVDDLRVIVRFVHLTAGSDQPALLLGAGLPDTPGHLHAVRTYTERWRFFRIGLLDAAETVEAIAEPATALGVTIEDEALERLVVETGGYPYFIQDYASAVWTVHRGDRITLADVEAVAPGVRRQLETTFYEERFNRLTPRELRYALALADLGDGVHASGDVARRLGTTSEALSSTRTQLVKKDVVFAPYPGSLQFRMPLTDRYVERNRANLERRAIAV